MVLLGEINFDSIASVNPLSWGKTNFLLFLIATMYPIHLQTIFATEFPLSRRSR